MTYLRDESKVVYQSKDGKEERIFDALEWLAAIPSVLEPQGSSKEFRKNWARLIQKVYEVDPLLCPKCQGQMKIISFIEEQAVIKQILQHLGLWEIRNTGPPPMPNLNIVQELTYQPVRDHAPADDGFWSQVPDYGYWAD